jgi:regulator of protease activity HflC (stomatin/prohibitin superfamily)
MDDREVNFVSRVGVGLAAFALLIVASSSWVTINQGHVGIVFNKWHGGVSSTVLTQGWQFKLPLIERVTEYPVALRTYSDVGLGEGNDPNGALVTLPTNGGQHIDQQMSVTYHIEPTKAFTVFDKFKGESIEYIETTFLRRNIQSVATAITGKYDLMDVLGPKKAEIQGKILAELKTELAPFGFVVDQVNLGYAKPPEAIEQSLQAKMQSEQRADAAKYGLQQAEMDAKAKIAAAEGEAKANALVRQQLSPEFLKFKALEVQLKSVEKWNGQVPTRILRAAG